MKASLPVRLVTIHTVLVIFFMFTLYKRWFLTDIPYDCFYVPFLAVSGPVVYFIAHFLQHFSERFLSPEAVMISWNLVPGSVCLLLGGFQWWFIGRVWLRFKERRANEVPQPISEQCPLSNQSQRPGVG